MRVATLGGAGTAEPNHRKSRHAPGYGTESLYRDRRENKEKKIKKRRRGRTTRPLERIAAREARARQKEALVAVATCNVRTLAVKGKNG